jgi:hypothetical protein
MIDDPVLLNDWHVVARASALAEGAAKPARLLGIDLVVWRSAGGVQVWDDLCVHRGAKLSGGKVTDGLPHGAPTTAGPTTRGRSLRPAFPPIHRRSRPPGPMRMRIP